jgi:hypothetical protein
MESGFGNNYLHGGHEQVRAALDQHINPNVAKIPYCRVGCAHQISLNSFVKGGQSPPYNNNIGLHYG